MIEHDHIAGQVLICRSQTVVDPRSATRMSLTQKSRIHLQQPAAVGEAIGIHRADHRHVVDARRKMRIQIRDRQPALAGRAELACAAQQLAWIADLKQGVGVQVGHRLAVVLIQFGLRIPQIDLARSAVHEQEDDRLRAGRKMRRRRRQRIGRFRGTRFVRKEPVRSQHPGQRRPRKPAAGFPEEFPTRAAARGQFVSISRHVNRPYFQFGERQA